MPIALLRGLDLVVSEIFRLDDEAAGGDGVLLILRGPGDRRRHAMRASGDA